MQSKPEPAMEPKTATETTPRAPQQAAAAAGAAAAAEDAATRAGAEPSKNPVKLQPGDGPEPADASRDDGGAAAEAPVEEASPSSEEAGEAAAAAPLGVGAPLEDRVVEIIKTIFDPEIPVNIYELGLIYDIVADESTGEVEVKMTLTSPACPVAGSLPGEVQQKIATLEGISSVDVDLVWDPTWNPSMMSEAARLELGFF